MFDPARYLFFIGSAIALLLTPGPAVLYIVARSVDQGRRAGIVSVLGITSATLFHIAAASLGVSVILAASALAFNALKYLGAAYLIYLGLRRLFFEKDAAPDTPPPDPRSLRAVYRQGVIVNLLNPKTALFFFAFLPQFADPSRGPVALQILLLGLTFIVLGFCSDSMYALAAGTLGNRLRGDQRLMRGGRLFSGSVYIGLGILTAVSGSKRA